MTYSRQHPDAPTTKQLRYLKKLADDTGGSFTYPQTKAQASGEIDRLLGRERSSQTDRRRETRAVQADMATGRGDASRIRDDELSGYGSNAHWAGGQ